MANADRIIELLHEAKARSAGAERDRFLDEACRDDAALKEQIVSLLRADAIEGDSDFLKNTLLLRPTAPVTEKPGDRIGRYKLLEQIGEGGCGVVYMAEQEEPVRRRVALKVIKLGMDTKQVIARFEAERQALAMMDHPNIAKVFDAGATDSPHNVAQASPPASSPGVSHGVGPGGGTPPKPAGEDACATLSAGRPYFVMELVRGIKITDYCDQNNLSTNERLGLFIQVCQAIQHAHQKGIIHRDIKPSNILVTQHDDVAVPKVIDFGIAKATVGQLTDKTVFTAFAQFVGTPAYMSPEQAQMSGLDVDTRADIYSLGVLLYELLTGNTPFDAKELLAAGMDEMRRKIREDEPAKPSTCLSTMQAMDLTTVAKHRHVEPPRLIHLIRGDLDWLVMKCLEKDRTRRYETANALAMDLQRHLNDEPVVARPPSTAYRFRKLVRRNKLAFAAAAAVVLVLLGGIAASTWQAIRATRAEREQSRLRQLAESSGEEARREKALALQAKNVALDSVYAGDMGLAKEALDQFQLPRVRELLRNHIPKPGEEDRRGVEWRYLSALARGEWIAAIPTSLDDGVAAVAITPNDKFIVAAGVKGGLRVIGLNDFKIKYSTNAFASGGCSTLAVSSDGQMIAVAGDGRNRSVGLWRLGADGGLTLIRRIDADSPYAVALSPDAKVLALGTQAGFWSDDLSAGGITKLFDVTSGQELIELPESGGKVVAFSPDGKWLATGPWRGKDVKIWDNDTRKLIKTVSLASPSSLEFSSDSQFLLLSTAFAELKRFDLFAPSEKALADETYDDWRMTKNMGYVRQAAISDDQRWVVMCCESATFLGDRTAKRRRVLFGHESAALCAAFNHSSAFLISGDRTGTILLWDTRGADQRRTRMTGMTGSVVAGFRSVPEPPSSPDGRKIAFRTVSHPSRGSGGVKIIDTRARRVSPILPTASSPIAFMDDKTLLTIRGLSFLERHNRIKPEWETGGDAIPVLEIWDIETVTNRSLALVAVPKREVSAVHASADGQLIALAWRDGDKTNGVVLLSSTTGEPRLSVSDIGSRIQGMAFSPDGHWLALACLDGTVPLLRISSGAKGPMIRCEGVAESPSFSADGKWMAVACWDAVRLFSMPEGQPIATLTGGAFRLRFSADGKTLITHGGTFARWWHLPTGRQMFTTTWPWSVVPESMILLTGDNVAAGCYPVREGIPDETVVFQLAPLTGSEEWLRSQPATLTEALR